MKHFYLFIAVGLISIMQVFSKSKPIKARVISISNDTTTVYLIDKKWKITPLVFQATDTLDGKHTIVLRPADIKEIRIDSGDYYIQAVVHVDMEYSGAMEMSKVYSTDTLKKDTIFLRVLIQGPVDLYLFTDVNNKDHFYVKTTESGFTELIDKYVSSRYVAKSILEASHVDTTLDYLIHISNFHDELKILMKDCPAIDIKINSLEYKERPLVKLFLTYSNCRKENLTYVTPVKTATTQLSVVAGVSLTKIQFNGIESSIAVHTSSYLYLSSFPVSIDPVIGFKFTLPITRTDDKISFHSSLLWWNYNTKSNYKDVSENEYFVHLKADYAKVALGPTYKFKVGRLQPFVSIGLIGMFLLHMVNDLHVEYGDVVAWTSGHPDSYDGEAYYHPASTDAGFYGSCGFMYNRFGFEARYNRSKGVASSTGMKTPVTSFEFLLSYNLLK